MTPMANRKMDHAFFSFLIECTTFAPATIAPDNISHNSVEWISARVSFTLVWNQVFDKNFDRSGEKLTQYFHRMLWICLICFAGELANKEFSIYNGDILYYIPHTKILAIRLVEMQSHDQRYFAYHVKWPTCGNFVAAHAIVPMG